MLAKRTTIATTATEICHVTASGSVVIRNPIGAARSVFVGGSGVTAATGFELQEGEAVTMSAAAGEKVYGIASGGTQDVHVLISGEAL